MRTESLILLAATLLLALPAAAQETVVDGPLGTRLDSAMQAAERAGFSGVVRVEKDGRVLLRRGYGLADRARRIPFTPASVVQIGSNTKDFTLVALLRLQARGKLRLDDSLATFFPEAPADKRGITLRQLANHRGGFPIGIGGDFERLPREAFVRRALATQLRATPGSAEIYSNTGYALLAAVIEQVTGKSYERHVRDDILEPLGLRETGYLLPGFDARRVARGYSRGEDQGTMLEKPHAPDGHWWNLRGNGGMLSTVDDMHRFYDALIDSERLVSYAGRGDRFDPRQPIALAGSDLVSFFLYERWPRERTTLVIASSSAEARGPRIRDALAPLLGLPTGERDDQVASGPPPDAKAPDAEDAALVRGFFEAVGGDSLTMRRFVEARFDGGAPVAARAERFGGMRARLGPIAPRAMWIGDGGNIHVVATTAEGPATFVFELDDSAPRRIRSVRVMVGG